MRPPPIQRANRISERAGQPGTGAGGPASGPTARIPCDRHPLSYGASPAVSWPDERAAAGRSCGTPQPDTESVLLGRQGALAAVTISMILADWPVAAGSRAEA